jgi:GTPase
LLGALVRIAPEGPAQFDADEITDRSERFLAAEKIRQHLVIQLRDELPYSTSVEIESWKRDGNLLRVGAIIWVEREGQKAIVIGKGGAQLKTIGTAARTGLERMLACKVHLETWVRVRDNWSDDERALGKFGIDQV